jgi:hypothetical protein
VRLNVLVYEYPFDGEIYLLGCFPRHSPLACPGVPFIDQGRQVVGVEYTGYDKSARKVLHDHKAYRSVLMDCYAMMIQEVEDFCLRLPDYLREISESRKTAFEETRALLSAIRN